MLKKINLGLVALALGFGLFFTTSAFTTRNNTFWAYQPNGDNDPTDYTKYVHTSVPQAECEELATLPCVIAVPDDVVTPTDLSNYFTGKTAPEIIDLSTGRTQPME